MKKENMEIKLQIDNVTNLIISERDDNQFLKNKLKEFKHRFAIFKEISLNKIKKLDNELNFAKEKERNYIIRKTGEKNKEKYNNFMNTLQYNEIMKKINEYQINLKKNNDIIRQYKVNNYVKKEENKNLKSDKEDLIYENEILKKKSRFKKNKNDFKKKLKNY